MTDLITPRLRLRQGRASDLEPFAGLNADPVVMEFMPGCPSRADIDVDYQLRTFFGVRLD